MAEDVNIIRQRLTQSILPISNFLQIGENHCFYMLISTQEVIG